MYQTFQCSNCNSWNYIGQELCGGCGKKLYYNCPQCGYGVETTFINCPNCRISLYWPTQQSMHLPVERRAFKDQSVSYRYFQTPQKKRTNPFLFLSLSLVVLAILVGGTIFTINAIFNETVPVTTTAAEAMSPKETLLPADDSNIANKIPKMTNMDVISVMDTSIVIAWVTDEPATSQMEYGTTNDYGSVTALDEELVTNHSITVTNLEPETTYYFRAKSKNAAGTEASYNANQTVKTLAKVDADAPVISATQISNISTTGCTISWKTDEPAISQVEYGLTTTYGSATGYTQQMVTNHSITITGLQQNAVYHFQIKTKDASGNISSSDKDATFRTSAPEPSGSTPSCCT